MRIAIVTFHRAYNCGAMLQAWALKTVLERKGHCVIFPDCNDVGEWCKLKFDDKEWIIVRFARWLKWNLYFRGLPIVKQVMFGLFMNKNLNHKKFSKEDWLSQDLIVVGSDQVWSEECAGKQNAPIFLGVGVPPSIPMIGYAISVGDNSLDESHKLKLRNVGNNRFARLSWREASLRDTLSLSGPVVCDPTLLLTKEDYRAVEYPRRLEKKRYLFVYVVSDAYEVVPAAHKIAESMGLVCVVANLYRKDFLRGGERNIWTISPDRFLAYIRDAEAVVTSSFHGCVFSLLYGKPFVCLSGSETKDNDKPGRQQDLLKRVGLLERRLTCKTSITEIVKTIRARYDCCEALDGLRGISNSYIEEILSECPRSFL